MGENCIIEFLAFAHQRTVVTSCAARFVTLQSVCWGKARFHRRSECLYHIEQLGCSGTYVINEQPS